MKTKKNAKIEIALFLESSKDSYEIKEPRSRAAETPTGARMSHCENCGATGIDPGSLRRPEPCPRCQGQKFIPSAYATMDRATARQVWNQIEDHRRHREVFGV